jgi:hypothetical protein
MDQFHPRRLRVLLRARRLLLQTSLVLAATLTAASTASAAVSFGHLQVNTDGHKESEAQRGSVSNISGGIQATIKFRHAHDDRKVTYALALQDSWYCVRSGSSNRCGWNRMHDDTTAKYHWKDGWRTSTMKESDGGYGLDYRSQPAVCFQQPWWNPDDCDHTTWLNP